MKNKIRGVQMLDFKRLELSSKQVFETYTKNKYENSEASFANMFIWSDFYNTKYCVSEGYLNVIFTNAKGELKSYMPYGNGDLKKCIDKLRNYFEKNSQKFVIVSANSAMADFIQKTYDNVSVTENIDFNDYVYSVESLINLSGKKLHSKKNHLNKFKASYDYVYREINERDFEECRELASRLMLKKRDANSMSYLSEKKSIEKVFDNFDYLGLSGGVIEIDGKICAFSVGEELTDNTALIHIEKADTSYDGIYAAINNEFVKNRWRDFCYVNREEDMGIEGLRKAKMSYKPSHMVQKYICEFND